MIDINGHVMSFENVIFVKPLHLRVMAFVTQKRSIMQMHTFVAKDLYLV
jgi:hypothetical protein